MTRAIVGTIIYAILVVISIPLYVIAVVSSFAWKIIQFFLTLGIVLSLLLMFTGWIFFASHGVGGWFALATGFTVLLLGGEFLCGLIFGLFDFVWNSYPLLTGIKIEEEQK